jgi:hypothetical protein
MNFWIQRPIKSPVLCRAGLGEAIKRMEKGKQRHAFNYTALQNTGLACLISVR